MQVYFKAFKAISIITICSIFSFVLNAALQIVLATIFGAKLEMDAYLLAVAVPMVIISLFTNTSEVVFVPFLKEIELSDTEASKRRMENVIFNFFLLALLIISILGVVLAPRIIKYLAPRFSLEKRRLAAILFRITIPSVLFGGLSGFMISSYHSREEFARPAFVNIINNSLLIITFFLLYPVIKINALAWGMLVGNIGQFLFLSPVLFKARKYLFTLNLKATKLKQVGLRFFQIFSGGIILGLIIPCERLLASRLPEGSISYLGYAGRIVSVLLFLPVNAVTIVILPILSRHFTTQNLDKLRYNLSLGVRIVFFLIFPICVLLFIFRTHLVYIFLERGNFDKMATSGVSNALVCYIGLLLGVSLANILGRGFFAIQNTFIPALIMVGSFLFYILIAIPLSRIFSYMGLALALSVTVLVGLIIDLFVLRRLLKGIGGRSLLISFCKVFISSLIMGVSSWFIYKKLTLLFVFENKFLIFSKICISVLIGFTVYIIFCFLFKLEELAIIHNTLFSKLNRRK